MAPIEAILKLMQAIYEIFRHAVAQLFEALRYKPEGLWFDSR
jgi:hypothetical protein